MGESRTFRENVTYADYASWTDDERWEVIDGVAHAMGPAPNIRHQKLCGNLLVLLKRALRHTTCQPFSSPVDVVLSETDVVQPDLLVVCDPAKISEANIQGAPDLVIEILSPSSAKMDRWVKKNLYRDYGVCEYLIVDPHNGFIEQYVLEEGDFRQTGLFEPPQRLALRVLPEVVLPLDEVFAD